MSEILGQNADLVLPSRPKPPSAANERYWVFIAYHITAFTKTGIPSLVCTSP
jgi:hypothetical protein